MSGFIGDNKVYLRNGVFHGLIILPTVLFNKFYHLRFSLLLLKHVYEECGLVHDEDNTRTRTRYVGIVLQCVNNFYHIYPLFTCLICRTSPAASM